MATTSSGDSFNPDLYLSPDQQDLLLTALSSNYPNRGSYNGSLSQSGQHSQPKSLSLGSPARPFQDTPTSMKFPRLYDSPVQQTPGSSDFGADLDSPFLDYDLDLDADGNFDLDLEGQMIGSLPGAPPKTGSEGGTQDKRKLPEGENEDDEGGGKRREGEDKTAKKPGRKPLTSEPTSVSRDTLRNNYDSACN
jgi:AP-1-like transcription factor